MAFAFNFSGMLSFASCVALAATISATGCIATNPVEFSEAQNYPPSVVSQPTAEYPLREIGQLDLSVSAEEELPLDVVIRDPNVDQTLEYRIFLNSPPPPAQEIPIDADIIEPQGGSVERPETFRVPHSLLVPGVCNKIELVVVGNFASFVEPRRPVEEGDFDDRVWWIEVIDADNPVVEVECR
ncbi:MAG: hypothetical protein JSV06_02770 [Myxococcales bacterium]|nr:MAG: hypothetical protein JSV06_02770 [Myxococcales bacterium]